MPDYGAYLVIPCPYTTRIYDFRNTANTRIRIAQCGKTSAVKYPMCSEGDRCGIAAFADMFSLSLQKHFR